MSHLSILPTVLRDADCLAATLEALGHRPQRNAQLQGFSGDPQPVDVRVDLPGGLALGWRRIADGSLALVGDLQRLSRSRDLEPLLGAITRAYAARLALHQARTALPEAILQVGV